MWTTELQEWSDGKKELVDINILSTVVDRCVAASFVMSLLLGGGGIIFSGCPCVHRSVRTSSQDSFKCNISKTNGWMFV